MKKSDAEGKLPQRAAGEKLLTANVTERRAGKKSPA